MVHTPGFWRDRRVLVTGHTGFKGSWLTARLCDLGASVHGVSLPAGDEPTPLWDQLELGGLSETRGDIASADWVAAARDFSPELVFHLAAQSLVGEGYRRPALTFRSNVLGTVQVLDALPLFPALRAAVVVTTDKVYDTRQPTPFTEGDFLGGKDPYSASKAGAELVAQSWPGLQVPVVTARAGNVIGGGDTAPDRIVPDLVRAWSAGEALAVRRPAAVRPWQHVIEPIDGYLSYAEAVVDDGSLPRSLNFGPGASQRVAVSTLVEFAVQEWRRLHGGGPPAWEVSSEPTMLETEDLTLDTTLARDTLGWSGVWDWQEALSRTLEWYAAVAGGAGPRDLVRRQFEQYAAAW